MENNNNNDRVVAAVRKGGWTAEEDKLLRNCIQMFGEGNWHKVPPRAGLKRCRKSCRLRWLNYLKPDIKRGYFSKDEVDLLLRLHKLLGNRWSLIAGRLPGRTANDVKNFWNTRILKARRTKPIPCTITPNDVVAIKPQPQRFSRPNESPLVVGSSEATDKTEHEEVEAAAAHDHRSKISHPPSDCSQPSEEGVDECIQWWSSLLEENGCQSLLSDHVIPHENDSHVWDLLN